MTVASHYQQTGISIHVGAPLFWDWDRRRWRERVDHLAVGWDQQTSADRGYDSASLELALSEFEIEDWLDQGIGRDVRVYNPSMCQVWGGFVNRISANLGNETVEVGPLVEIANRCAVSFGYLDDTVDPPIQGDQMITTLTEDTDSQYEFGIWHKVYPGGQSTITNAEKLRDTYLAETLSPQTSKDLAAEAGIGVSLELLGYWAFLEAYIYNYTTAATSVTTEAKIQYVIEADPNGVYSRVFSYLEANGWLVSRYEDKDRLALEVIIRAVELGDASDLRWTFGIYEDQRAYYRPVPTEIAYQNRLLIGSDVETFAPPGGRVDPWDVEPAQWIIFPDFFTVGEAIPVRYAELCADPRVEFIESVRFAAPGELLINGERVGTLRQMLAKRAL